MKAMNEKNKGKRRNISVDRKWHRRYKMLAITREKTLEELIDDASEFYFKSQGPTRMMRGAE